jgi:hypothetical protein
VDTFIYINRQYKKKIRKLKVFCLVTWFKTREKNLILKALVFFFGWLVVCVYKISDENFTPLFFFQSRLIYIYFIFCQKKIYIFLVCVCVSGKKRTKYVMFIINRAKSISYVQIYVFFFRVNYSELYIYKY